MNTSHAERLIKSGQMASSGLKAVTAAKADGRWQAAYDSPRNAMPPEDFLKALNRDKKAKAFFATLNRANIYAIVYRLQTARKPETRERRMKMILEMLARGESFHPLGGKGGSDLNRQVGTRLIISLSCRTIADALALTHFRAAPFFFR